MHLIPVGPRAVLVEVADAAAARSLAAWAREARTGARDVVPAARSVLLDGLAPEAADRLPDLLAGWTPGDDAAAGEVVEVAVTYDGPDLDDVAQRWGTDRDGVVAAHGAVEYVAEFCGFAPGFAYLSGLPEERSVPRLDSPRTSVPAGAVALAGTWCGVYPTASPGGWRILGTTTAALWEPDRDPPALLAPGTRVRFRAV